MGPSTFVTAALSFICLLIEWDEFDSFELFKWTKYYKKELKLPEMTQKHWCRTSKSAAEAEFRVSATL
jgi:hypothetical protein